MRRNVVGNQTCYISTARKDCKGEFRATSKAKD